MSRSGSQSSSSQQKWKKLRTVPVGLSLLLAAVALGVSCSDQVPTAPSSAEKPIRLNVSPGLGPNVSTDKYDYLPGETVIIGGSGWTAGETVTLQVVHVDDTGDNTADVHQPWTVTADSAGNITGEWLVALEGDESGATLLLTADGATSAAHAEVSFTDLTGSAAARLFNNANRDSSQSAFPYGATIYPRLEGASTGICYRIRWFNPSDAVQQTNIIGKGSSSYNPPSYTVPASGPSGTWYVLVDENNGALDCNSASYGNATNRINFDVARAVIIGAATTGSDASYGDRCVFQTNAPAGSVCNATGNRLAIRPSSTDPARAFVRFGLGDASPAAIPSTAVISNATFRLTVSDFPGTERRYNVQRASSSWGEASITFATAPGVTGAIVRATMPLFANRTLGAGGGDPQTWVKWNVTSDVQGFVADPTTNHGWRISDSTETGGVTDIGLFWSTESTAGCSGGLCRRAMPVLLVDYTTSVPDNTGIVTEIHDPSLDPDSINVSSVPLGSTVHDKATVSNTGGGTGNGTPQGTVSFTFWTDGTCGTNGGTSSSAGSSVAVNGSGIAHPSNSKGPLAAGSYSFKASFTSSDATKWNNSVGSCEPLTVQKATPTLTTAIHKAPHVVVPDSSYVYEGTVMHDSGALTGVLGGVLAPTGTIKYYFYRNNACSGTASDSTAALALPGGSESAAFPGGQPLGPGQYAYKAKYSGDSNYNPDASDCEPFQVVPYSSITGGGLCTFDRRSDVALQQFNAIFTPEVGATTSKLNATNPGQFRFNVFYIPDDGATSLSIKIPAGFVTQGATPVHVYGAVTSATSSGVTCFTPSSERSAQQLTVTGASGGTINVDISNLGSPSPKVIYIVVHLDYYWKGVLGGCTKQVVAGTPPLEHANCTVPTTLTLNSLTNYKFEALGNSAYDKTIQNFNVFKKDPGIGGLILRAGSGDPVPNVVVDIYQGGKKVGTATSDEDGWYMWVYKYTGKATTFTIKLPAYNLSQDFTLKSNGYGIVNFTVP